MRSGSEPPDTKARGQLLTLYRVDWDAYVRINDALEDHPGVRMVFSDRRLTFMKPSRSHEWCAEKLANLTVAVASGLRILWEDAGRSTFRRADLKVGVEGDKIFYFGEHAELMLGPEEIDLAVQPPPDLAIEVEVSDLTDHAMIVWGRLGVPEVWRFDAHTRTLGFWLRGADGDYVPSERGRAFPVLTAGDVVDSIRLAERVGSSAWHRQLDGWVREEIRPRLRGGD